MSARRAAAVDGLHLFALSGFAVAQPLFDLLGRHGAFFVAQRSQPIDLLAVAVLLCVPLPAILFAVERCAGWCSPRGRRWLHLVWIAALALLIVLPVVKRLGVTAPLPHLGLSAAFAVGFTLAYAWAAAVRVFVTALAVAPPIFCAHFLLVSPVAKLLLPHAASWVSPAGSATTPVVLVIFDEFPLAPLLDEALEIDAARYPHLAALAREATWFPNAAAISDHTWVAVPALLTGRYPSDARLATFSGYPDNLFTLLGGTHDLHVVEALTQLCPESLCAPTERPSPVSRLRWLFDDLWIVYLHIVLPQHLTGALPPITQTWAGFRAPASAADETPEDSNRRFEEAVSHLAADRAVVFRRFIEAIRPQAAPGLYFLHILLPHLPWNYLPSGRAYHLGITPVPGLNVEQWQDAPQAVRQARDRYLMQVGFVDRLIGELVAHLKATGTFDDTLLILTADHGVSFRPNDSRRHVTATNVQDLLPVPLFVKRPNQRTGVRNERRVMATDLLPTIAAELGIGVPWPVDGVSALDPAAPEHAEYLFFGDVTATQHQTFAPGSIPLREAVRWFRGPSGRDDPASVALLGRALGELTITDAPRVGSRIIEASHLAAVDLGSGFVPALLTGNVRPLWNDRPVTLAIALNGVIQDVTPGIRHSGNEAWFCFFLPEAAFRNGHNTAEVFIVNPDNPSHLFRPTAPAS